MADWEVIEKYMPPESAVQYFLTLGFVDQPHIYVLKHIETGEIKRVLAEDRFDLGEHIADGDFVDMSDDED